MSYFGDASEFILSPTAFKSTLQAPCSLKIVFRFKPALNLQGSEGGGLQPLTMVRKCQEETHPLLLPRVGAQISVIMPQCQAANISY